ncbi:complement C1q tumor necrosis factor-related protein 3-like [Mercenaria mercenaria]|uniref:complement C1q tumor necrosis factor-related protein 3-like n=1 Tax=Mercenaria mercenaria TaxID=6596 RepID=UPI00234F3722|nr:complement C1q tumor necrosis factor-related protein 3-like [Mercenaria mercenaria]
MISIKSNETDTQMNRNVQRRHDVHFGDAMLGLKQLITSHERNYGKKHSIIKAKHTHGSGDYRILTPVNEEPVVFFATLGKHIINTGVHQVIPFDNLITNVGNGYNPHAGDFRAPVAEVYVFSVSLLTYHDTTSGDYAVWRNGTVVSSMYLRGETGSQTVIFELSKGDDGAVICSEAKYESVGGHGYSTFAGFLLQKTHHSSNLVGRK